MNVPTSARTFTPVKERPSAPLDEPAQHDGDGKGVIPPPEAVTRETRPEECDPARRFSLRRSGRRGPCCSRAEQGPGAAALGERHVRPVKRPRH